MAESLYVALIGDIHRSREITDRAALQRRLSGLADQLSMEPGRTAAPLTLTAGDEIQALLLDPAYAVDIIVTLADELAPVRIRWGVGRGTLTTDVTGDVAEIDGPAFHRARNALGIAQTRGIWVVAEGFGPAADSAITGLFTLMNVLRSRWTEKQGRYSRDARTMMQKDVAARYGVSPSVVSESLKAAAHDAVLAGEQAARDVLAQFNISDEQVAGAGASR